MVTPRSNLRWGYLCVLARVLHLPWLPWSRSEQSSASALAIHRGPNDAFGV
jgi:hypothetical protein